MLEGESWELAAAERLPAWVDRSLGRLEIAKCWRPEGAPPKENARPNLKGKPPPDMPSDDSLLGLLNVVLYYDLHIQSKVFGQMFSRVDGFELKVKRVL